MFYVTNKSGSKYGVIDTEDMVADLFTKKELLDIERKRIASIDGVDLQANAVFVVRPVKDTIKLIRKKEFRLALETLTTMETIGIRFKSKPTKGELVMVNMEVINISRDGVDSYAYDWGYSKSYRSDLTIEDMVQMLWDFRNWDIDLVQVGEL